MAYISSAPKTAPQSDIHHTPPKRLPLATLAQYALFIILSLLTATPLLWIVSLSLKERREFLSSPFALPQRLNLDNYVQLLQDPAIMRFLQNSIFITGISLMIVLTVSALAAYAIARISFSGDKFVFFIFLIGNSIPILALVIPLYVLMDWLHLGNSRWAIIFAFVARQMGVTVLILRGFFRTIPSDLEDAAGLDGCNLIQIIWHIILPIARPGLVAAAAIDFISFWNDYYLTLVLSGNQEMMTIPAGLAVKLVNFHSTNWPPMAAGMILSLVPVIALFIWTQERIISGWSNTK